VQTVDPSYGTVDDLDELIHQASSHNIRVLLTLNSSVTTSDLTAAARFWLNHGVAGFHLAGASGGAEDAYVAQVGELRKVTNSYVGQRIVVGDLGGAVDAQGKVLQGRDRGGAQLVLDPRAGTASQLSAAAIRPAIEASQELLQSGVMSVLLSDGSEYARSMSRYGDGTHDVAIAKVLATVLLASRAGSLIYYGQEIGVAGASGSDPVVIHWDAPPAAAKGAATAAKGTPAGAPSADAAPNVALEDADKASLLNWYRQLSVLHHGNGTVGSGSVTTINRDDQNVLVWVREPKVVSKISPPVVIICNLSGQPVQLSLKDDIKRLHLRGSFLRTVLRSDAGSGPMHLESMTIPPFGVYIGELRF
jgi:alpha-glucosidase